MADKKRIKRRYPLGSDVEEPPTGSGPDEIAERERAGEEPGEDAWRDLLVFNKTTKKPTACESNHILIFRNDHSWKGRLAYNERSLKICWKEKSEICNAAIGDELRERHAGEAVVWLSAAYGISTTKARVYDTMVSAAYLETFDPVRDWLNGLTWDKIERLDRWLPDAIGCPATPYAMTIGAKWMISAVARALRPGCKVDTMLILCGPQGTLKSSLLAELGGAWFSDQIGEIGKKDTLLQIHGPWLIEMSELDSMTKREATSVKAFLTTTIDRFRRPYGRGLEDYARRCIFAGTTNMDMFLRDDTGGRRFWPIEIEAIDLRYVKESRSQLFAEAVERFRAGEVWWLDENAEVLAQAAEEQEKRRQVEPWEDRIASWLKSTLTNGNPTTNDILAGIDIDTAKRDRGAAMRVGFAMKRLGWRKKRRRVDGLLTWVFLPPIHLVGEGGDEGEERPQEEPSNREPEQRRFDEY